MRKELLLLNLRAWNRWRQECTCKDWSGRRIRRVGFQLEAVPPRACLLNQRFHPVASLLSHSANDELSDARRQL